MVVIGEVAVALQLVGWFVSPNITDLMKAARDSAATRYELFRGSKQKLGKLAQDLEGIKCLLDQSKTSFVNDQARLDRLWRLKDDIHDTEEVLDLFELKKLDIQAASNNLIQKKKHLGNKLWLSGQLEKVLKNIGEARDTARELIQHWAVSSSSTLTRAETGPNPVRDEKSFFGYQAEYAQLVSMLWQDGHKVDNKMQKVIAIVGHGGMGKTELARQAFRDARGKFDLRIWVHAYNKNTEFDLLKEIWRSVAGDRPVGEMNVSSLQMELEKMLASKWCLLVLDDVWNHEWATSEVERSRAWLAVHSFFHFVQGGSRVVMTTRAKICSTTFKADASIILNGIKAQEVIYLLNDTAKLSMYGTTGSSDQRVQELLNKQVPELKGSPLAAIEIGDELKKQATSDKCCNILDNIDQNLGSVLSGHLLTYRHLPPHLQRCFEFCNIFPNNWRFEPEKLTRMWIAHGFIEDAHQGPSKEHVARGYFDSLVERSLFEEQCELGGKETTYVIHEQIHWMIRLASAKNCISISDRHSAAHRRISTTVRHLSITSGCLDELKANPGKLQLNNIRTLLILKNDDGGGDTTIDKGILKQFKGVRVLDLTNTCLTQLPGTIGKLKHVRYLGLPSTMRTLCEQLTGLLFLQTFSISNDGRRKENTCQLQRFPENMNKLINMRHLDINTECIANISGIRRMVKLQGSTMRGSEKEGHGMSELAGLNSLGGTLSIKGLDAVASKEEATAAQLASKGSVKVLKLEWGPPDLRQVNGGPTDTASAVLEGLQPHRNLCDLHIIRYPGAMSPSWLGMSMEKLVCLYLRNCRRLQALPAVSGLPCLELLDVKELPCVEKIDGSFCDSGGAGAFPKLKKIVLDDMPRLVAWDSMPKLAFPQLRAVCIVDCPSLSSLSGLECCKGHRQGMPGNHTTDPARDFQ